MDGRHVGLILMGLITLSLYSCDKDRVGFSRDELAKPEKGDIIHRERRVPIPKEPSRNKLKSLSLNAPDIRQEPYNVIGAVHSVGNGFLGHPRNIGNGGVIDVSSILEDKISSKFLFNRDLDLTTSRFSIYHNFDSIKSSIDRTKIVKSGFKLNLGLFSIGKRNTYTNIFSIDKEKRFKHTLAELDFLYYAKRIGIETTESAIKTIAIRNLDDQFIQSIYSYPISNYIKEKGFLVVTDFYTGGRLQALFNLKQEWSSSVRSDTSKVNSKIKAAFGWGDKVSDKADPKNPQSANKNNVSLNIGYTDNKGNGESRIESSEYLDGFIEVHGGNKNSGIPSTVIDLGRSSINIGDWYSSLSDEKTHKYIDINEGGLVSIGEFMLEANFRYRLQKTLLGELPYKTTMDIPYLEIRSVSPEILSSSLWEEAGVSARTAILHTRHGDNVIFMDKDFNNRVQSELFWDGTDSERKYKEQYKRDTEMIVQTLEKVFGCEIKSLEGKYDRILDRDEFRKDKTYLHLKFSLHGDKIYKYKNPRTNIWYIYDLESRTAMSYYDSPDDEDDDTYITDMYGMTEWVESLNERKISMKEISMYYRIIGL